MNEKTAGRFPIRKAPRCFPQKGLKKDENSPGAGDGRAEKRREQSSSKARNGRKKGGESGPEVRNGRKKKGRVGSRKSGTGQKNGTGADDLRQGRQG